MKTISIEDLAEIIFNLVPKEIQEKYAEDMLGKVLTLKERFISYCESNWKLPKYSKEETEKKVKEILKKTSFYEDEKFDFSIFDEVLEECFS